MTASPSIEQMFVGELAMRDTSLLARFMAKVDVRRHDECWAWTASLSPDGYGRFGVSGLNRHAHRVSYQLFVGAIPDGLEIAHTCHNRQCVNPGHLVAVTHAENIRMSPAIAQNARRSHCRKGHPLEDPNLYYRSNGSRQCLTCVREISRRHNKARSERRKKARNH